MPTSDQVQELLDRGLDYEAAGRELGIPAGQAYMIATGVPADGSGTVPDQETPDQATPDQESEQRDSLPASSQHLANPPAHNPTRDESVQEWIKARARADNRDG
ncbi:MAG TPA: hypothetical protein VGG25_03955 [Streptosporangiaceae bacterium]|jgi:hypothetical protein